MGNDNKLIKIANFNKTLNRYINTDFGNFSIYYSKGLQTHMIKRKHYAALKYIDYLSDIIEEPNYIGYINGSIELVKIFNTP